MKKYFYLFLKIISILCFIIIFSKPVFSIETKEINELKESLKQNTGFNEKEIESLIALIESAQKDSLLYELLANRVKEGIARKVNFKAIFNVVNSKLQYLNTAKKIIKEQQGLVSKDQNYSVQVLSELIEKGLNQEEFKTVCGMAVQNKMTMEETLHIGEALIKLREEKFSFEFCIEIIAAIISKKPKIDYVERVIKIIIQSKNTNIKQEEVKDIIIDGINRNLNTNFIEKSVNENAGHDEIDTIERKGKKGEINDEIRNKRNEDDKGKGEENDRKR